METLRGAIEYIRQLQQLLAVVPDSAECTPNTDTEDKNRASTVKVKVGSQVRHDHSKHNGCSAGGGAEAKKRRDSSSPDHTGMSGCILAAPDDEHSHKKRRVTK